jgi:hypothetical protein
MTIPRLLAFAMLSAMGLVAHAGMPHQNTPVERFGALIGAELLAGYTATSCRAALPRPDDYESADYNAKIFHCLAYKNPAGRPAMWAELSNEPEFKRMDAFARERAREAFFTARSQDTMQGFHDAMRALRLSLGDPIHGNPHASQMNRARIESASVAKQSLPLVASAIIELYRLEALDPRFVARAAQDPDNTTSDHGERSLDIAIDSLADAWLIDHWKEYHADMAQTEEHIAALRRLAQNTQRVPKSDIVDKINALRARQLSWQTRARTHGETEMARLGLNMPASTD